MTLRETAEARTPPVGDRRRGKTFAALAFPAYRWLFVAGLFSFFAVQVQMIARGWLAYELTGSNSGLGGVFLGFGVPMLLATPFGGVAADRLSKRRLMVGALVLLAASALFIAAGVQWGFVSYWMLIAASAAQGLGFAFMGPARMAFASELVGREALPNAVVLGQMSMNSTRIFGPAIAGVLIAAATWGIAAVFFAAGACTLMGALIVMLRLPPGRPAPGRIVQSPLAELADGVRYVRRHRHIALLVLTSYVVVMVAYPYIAFLPEVAEGMFSSGSNGYGTLSAVSAVGALAASFFIASRAGGSGAWRIQTLAGFGVGITVGLLAGAPEFAVAVVVVLFIGAASAAFQSMNNSLVLMLADLEYHGRVQSIMMLSFSGFGMAALPIGILADAIGLRATLAGMGLVTVAAMTLYTAQRRRLDAAGELEPA